MRHCKDTLTNFSLSLTLPLEQFTKLEYLAVYGRASMGDYYGCAFRKLAVFRQLLTHGQKFDPESLYEPI